MASDHATHVSLAPWITVSDGKRALEFYKNAFGAIIVYQLDTPDDSVVARLSISGAEFWISGDNNHQPTSENSVRLILTVDDPDAVFVQAITAGATEIFPVEEAHGWRLGRLSDPFGLHWEVGKVLG